MKKILNIFKTLVSSFKFNFVIPKEQKDYSSNLPKSTAPLSSKNILLVPLMDDFGTMKIVLKLAVFIAKEEDLSIKFFFVHSAIDTNFEGASMITIALSKLHSWKSLAPFRRLLKTYGIKSEDVIMSNYFDTKRSSISKDRFTSKSDVLSFKHIGIELGELLYDTFLRFRSKPTIEINNDELYRIQNYIVTLTDKWDHFFKESRVKKILMPYLAYHHWGVPGKVALKHSIEVMTFGSTLYILQEAREDYPYHSKNFKRYRDVFKGLKNKDLLLNIAKKNLENRLSGIVDSGISYMKKSAFSESNEQEIAPAFPSTKNWAVIFLHCFFDSPHIYGDGLFADFYEWTLHLLNKAAQNQQILYYVKSHPNGLPENTAVIEIFIKKYAPYPNIIFLPKTTSNNLIIKNKPGAIFTYYGTVAHEFSYLNIPAVTCGKNPHSYYSFVYNADSIEQLNFYIDNVGSYSLPAGYNRKDIEEFFYMHYLYYSPSYNQQNFNMDKNISDGTIHIPLKSTVEELLFAQRK